MAYAVTRSLGRRYIRVYTADFLPGSMSSASRYSSGSFLYPSPFSQQSGFVETLIEKLKLHCCNVLIPVGEETYLIAKHKQRFLQHTGMAIPDYDQILAAHNKDQWGALAAQLNIRCPAVFAIDDIRQGRVADLPFPLLIKPKQGGGGWGIVQVDSPRELEALLGRQEHWGRPWDRFFVQEKIQGQTHCVAMLFRQGEYRARVGYRQLRSYPIKCGQATLRISVEHRGAEESLQRLLEALNWHGVCQADFIIENRSGAAYLIDVNPRFWGSLAQGIACGVDFPYMVYKIAARGDVPPQDSFRTGVITRWIGGDMAAFVPSLKEAGSKIAFLREYFWPHRRASHYDDLSISDPLPFMYWMADALYRSVKKRGGKSRSHESLEGIWE
ncbi:ATP-grasp domain-containing protein [Geotalea sp. SG265]|uniref:carboxylate--amine ligase n=1 Tax=Geotalea sp. SG265 TaxID=2922867 RepID=UPI001FB03A62|nr:ATP-grasp domain-containing protein [Geotalea sp. SG265]